jgi:hypothetical protein
LVRERSYAIHAACRRIVCGAGRLDATAQTDGASTNRTREEAVDFLTGLTNFTNWSGNVIMPTLAGIFFVIAVLRAARSAPFQYAMYAGLMSLTVSGILRGIETFSRVRAWNDPDQVWVTLLGLVNWSANVFLPVYGVLQVVMALLHYGGAGFRIYPGAPWARHVMIAMASFSVSGLLRMAEFFVQQGTGGIS